jgi:WD40 repeat protein
MPKTVAISHDNSVVAVALLNKQVYIVDMKDWHSEKGLMSHNGSHQLNLPKNHGLTKSLLFAQGSDSLIVVDEWGQVSIWSQANGYNACMLSKTINQKILGAHLSKNNYLTLFASNGDVHSMPLNNLAEKTTLWFGHKLKVTSFAVSPSGYQVALGTSDGVIMLFSWSGGGKLMIKKNVFNNHVSSVNSISFNQKGDMMVSEGMDKSLLLYKLDKPNLTPIELHDKRDWIWSVKFAPGSSKLYYGCHNQKLAVQETDVTKLVSSLESKIKRKLTKDEVDAYLGIEEINDGHGME